MDGSGIFKDSNGNIVSCMFSKGIKTGFAEIKLSNGNSVKGEYKDGKLCGAS